MKEIGASDQTSDICRPSDDTSCGRPHHLWPSEQGWPI